VTNDSETEVAKRLALLQAALGYKSSGAFAAYLGVTPARWSNIRCGTSLSLQVAKILCKKSPGLTLDWLYFGKVEGLPVAFARELGVLGRQSENATTKTDEK
jgi:hypothetical protein